MHKTTWMTALAGLLALCVVACSTPEIVPQDNGQAAAKARRAQAEMASDVDKLKR